MNISIKHHPQSESRLANLRLALIVSSPLTVNFYRGQLTYLKSQGFGVTVVCPPGEQLDRITSEEETAKMVIPIEREIDLVRDGVSLWRLCRFFRRYGPTIVDFSNPKAALLAGVAACFARVPCRVYTLRGLRMETVTGFKRLVLRLAERVSCTCAHRVICVSPSLQQRAIDLGLVNPEKAVVLGSGSSKGVEVERFLPTGENLVRAEGLRRALNLPKGVPVIGFVGRFTRDKGIPELVEAYRELRAEYPELRLLLVGAFEDGDPVPEAVRREIVSDSKIVRPGFVADTSAYYHLMDVLALPTHREGFPNVALEAQAAGKPVVTTRATGAIDSVLDGKTGLLVPVGDASALARAIGSLLADPAKREEMGHQGQQWVAREFAGDKVRAALVDEYTRLLRIQGLSPQSLSAAKQLDPKLPATHRFRPA